MIAHLLLLFLTASLSQGQTAGTEVFYNYDDGEIFFTEKASIADTLGVTPPSSMPGNIGEDNDTRKEVSNFFNGTTEENDISSTNTSEANVTQGISNIETTSSTDKPTEDHDLFRKHHEKKFFYDYYCLRKWGLVCSAILFVMGFLVLGCGKFTKSNCRRTQRRKYNIAAV